MNDRWLEWYKKVEMVTYLQIASTWEGIRACEILQKQGIETNMTLLFSFAQVSFSSFYLNL